MSDCADKTPECAENEAFFKNYIQSQANFKTYNTCYERTVPVLEKSLRVFLGWRPGHQLVDLPLCGADDVEGFVVWSEITRSAPQKELRF